LGNKSLQDESATEYTTRLLSGSSYYKGILGAFALLENLRSDRYKAKSPENRLDLDRIAFHAISSVSLSVMVAVISVGIWLLQAFFMATQNGWLALLLSLAGALLIASELVYLRWSIARGFLKQFYNADFQITLPAFSIFHQPVAALLRSQLIQSEPLQNVITFGRYQPFLGAGGQISKWTIAIDRKPAEHQSPEPSRIDIPVKAFYQATDQEVTALKLPYLKGFAWLFVDGFELDVDGKILTDMKAQPESILSEPEIWSIGQGDLRSNRRTYRLYRYTDTERDQVLSYFLRFDNVGSVTFIESSAHILPCIDRRRFSLTPVLKDSKISRLCKTIALALLFTFSSAYVFVALGYLGIFAWKLLSWRFDDNKQSREANWNEEYNYGHVQTFRESIAAKNYESYYGVQDLTLYWKAIENAILDSTIKLLKQRGVDTSQFEQASSTIVNSGIMVSGGNFSATQVAAGQGAQAVNNSINKLSGLPIAQPKNS
jgi:hypothetical protein